MKSQVCYFFADRISKMAATGQLSLPLDPMGISLKNLFVRNYSTNLIFCVMLKWPFGSGELKRGSNSSSNFN
jgi:hypothetical protein